jgi:hypothetical protein
MTITAMMTYFSAFLQPSTYFGYDGYEKKLSTFEKEIAEIKRQKAEKDLADLQLKRNKKTHAVV